MRLNGKYCFMMTICNKRELCNKFVTKEQQKAYDNLDRQAAKIPALSSGNVGKCEFLTGKDVLP